MARLLHFVMFVTLVAFGWLAKLGPVYYAAMPLVAAALMFEHRSARRLDVAAINRAFFQTNAFFSAVFLAAVCLDQWLRYSRLVAVTSRLAGRGAAPDGRVRIQSQARLARS